MPVAVAVPPLATLWEWTPSSGVSGERNGPPEAIVPATENTMPTMVARGVSGERNGPPEAIVPAPENTMATMVAHDFAAASGVSGECNGPPEAIVAALETPCQRWLLMN